MRRAPLVSLWLVLFSANASADSDRESVRLTLERGVGAEQCPDENELGRRVAARLGRDPISERAERVIDVRVTRGAEHWRAEIRVLDAAGRVIATRDPLESTAADCKALADAIVLSVALSIDPDAALGAPPPPPRAPPAPAVAPCPASVCPVLSCPECPPPLPEPESLGARVGIRAIGAIGVLPSPAPGVALAAEIAALSSLQLGIAMLYLPEIETDDGELAFGLTAAELFACPMLIGDHHAGAGPCAGFQAGSMHALARGLRPIEPGDYLWLAASLGARGLIEPSPHLSLELGAEAVAPLIAHEFVVRGREGSAHQPNTIGFFGWLGIGVRAP